MGYDSYYIFNNIYINTRNIDNFNVILRELETPRYIVMTIGDIYGMLMEYWQESDSSCDHPNSKAPILDSL